MSKGNPRKASQFALRADAGVSSSSLWHRSAGIEMRDRFLDLCFGVMVADIFFFSKEAGLACPCNDRHSGFFELLNFLNPHLYTT